MKNTLNKLFLMVFLSSPHITLANDYTIYGEGNRSCGEWTSERASGNWHSKGQWMLGVISAVNYYYIYELEKTDSQAFAAWMDNYCEAHPLDEFSKGVFSLIDELARKRNRNSTSN
ncbi:hypothetical protein [Plesiomonas shigelloides]|uniref:hypothetical protein n=1 Tax=Plesiomonas shigelloides TaxID=703 RepID=UPI0012618E2F|nr:hypothetical protein [Plesiomonas shigelloides]KAB7678716.1 hypothetical protein GBN16_05505 [Plesiomonas shigelloides]